LSSTHETEWDLVVIGGGAAGFFGAIAAAESAYKAHKILIVEKSPKVLSKVRISGGGRCNVTHACFDPRIFSTHYPRGEKELIGPLNRWSSTDTIDWFQGHGVPLKAEPDGRMFPTTNDSQTIIDCLETAVTQSGIEVRLQTSVSSIRYKAKSEYPFSIELKGGKKLEARKVLLATGGTRSADTVRLIEELGHTTQGAVPSLFTFNIKDAALQDLAGVSVEEVKLSIPRIDLQSKGPLLITHWGLSGPAILKLSAWGARKLHTVDYRFTLSVNWVPNRDLPAIFKSLRNTHGKRTVALRSPIPELPKRLWERLVKLTRLPESTAWAQLSKAQELAIMHQLTGSQWEVDGKSLNKEEFVTCGGVELHEVNLKTMESRLIPGLYFAGEVLNIDGITGGFNFQNAWTTGHLAGIAISQG
jgi:predicted Rossmann fold flavoprotein